MTEPGDTVVSNGNGGWSISAGTDHTSADYDRLGRVTTATDQRGVVHGYYFDTAGRPWYEFVDCPGGWGDIDHEVREIARAYDSLGRVELVTSYGPVNEAMVVRNQVRYGYDGWGKLASEKQAHDGIVGPGTPEVQYTYEDGAVGGVAQYVRLATVEYPGGARTVSYDYNTGDHSVTDEIMSRLSSIGDGAYRYPAYSYLGLRDIVTENYIDSQVAPQVKLDYTTANVTGDYTGFDRFGRVADQVWSQVGQGAIDEYRYEYDRGGNRTARDNETHSAFDEDYLYDGLDRLVEQTDTNLDKQWRLDAEGNWSRITGNNTTLWQNRLHNASNELGQIVYDPNGTPASFTPQYDPAGNMTILPNPAAPTTALHAVYDAWNRLTEIYDASSNPIEKYSYDGTGRRIQVYSDFSSGVAQTVTDDYHSGQQVIETREATRNAGQWGTSLTKYQFIWSPRYIDAPILRDTYSGGILQPAERIFYLSDANYNVTGLVKKVANAWQVVARYAYDAYGTVTTYDGVWLNPSQSNFRENNTTLFAGRELSALSGLYYNRARYYDPQLGRFTNRDPIRYGGGMNLYAYVAGEPTRRSDPTGTKRITVCPITPTWEYDGDYEVHTQTVTKEWERGPLLSGNFDVTRLVCACKLTRISRVVTTNIKYCCPTDWAIANWRYSAGGAVETSLYLDMFPSYWLYKINTEAMGLSVDPEDKWNADQAYYRKLFEEECAARCKAKRGSSP